MIDYMRGELVPRLQSTYDDLQARSAAAAEAEVAVSALIEELEDVNDAVESTKRSQRALVPTDDEDPEGILEAEVIDLLKNLLGTMCPALHSLVSSCLYSRFYA